MTEPSKPSTTNPQTPSHNDNLTLQISTMILNGKIFMEWSQSAKISLMGKGKFKYVNGALPTPVVTDPIYEAWEIENSLVILLPTAHNIWTAASKTYSKVGSASQIFQIIQKTKQGASSVTKSFNILKGLLIEVNLYTNLEMESPTHARWVKEMLE